MRNENQKPVTDKYRNNWNKIFCKKKTSEECINDLKDAGIIDKCGNLAEQYKEDVDKLFGSYRLHSDECPPAYNGCQCECHRNPNIKHIAACCYPTVEED